MAIYAGKAIIYDGGKDDIIKSDTRVIYVDRHDVKSEIDMRALIKKCKKCRQYRDFHNNFISDIEGGGLYWGYPVIAALGHVAEELGDEIYECIKQSNSDKNSLEGRTK